MTEWSEAADADRVALALCKMLDDAPMEVELDESEPEPEPGPHCQRRGSLATEGPCGWPNCHGCDWWR